ncbi:hypothetical protein [Nibribacter koreensis]|uniref:DUF3168 domain-containing protein n=1 Tax=Nibribacter koreensis TaxID=1084519 RepID=A0ABP8FBL5_9BACT
MRDPQQALRNAYLSLLENQVFIAGPAYAQVYADFVPSTAARPYVLLSQQTVADGRTGNCPSAECTILVEIVWEVQGNLARTSEVNAMAEQAMQALKPLTERPTNVIEGFEVNQHYLEGSNTITEADPTSTRIRRLLRFRDVVFETIESNENIETTI